MAFRKFDRKDSVSALSQVKSSALRGIKGAPVQPLGPPTPPYLPPSRAPCPPRLHLAEAAP